MRATKLLRGAACAGLILAGAAATNADAGTSLAIHKTVIVTGPAGGIAYVHLAKSIELTAGASTASSGGFAGIGITTKDRAHWFLSTTGVTTTCAFGPPCTRQDIPEIFCTGYITGTLDCNLPAGDYTIGLLGQPGSTVTGVLTVPNGPAGTTKLRTTSRHPMQVANVVSPVPGTSPQQPETVGAATMQGGGGATFAGVTMRWDVDLFHLTEYNVCFGSAATLAATMPPTCPGLASNTIRKQYGADCGVAPTVCIAGADASPLAFSDSWATTTVGSSQFAVSISTAAAMSQVTVTAYALTV